MLGKNLKPTEKINNVGNGGSLHDKIAFSICKSQRNWPICQNKCIWMNYKLIFNILENHLIMTLVHLWYQWNNLFYIYSCVHYQ